MLTRSHQLLLQALGCIFVALGMIGAVLPVMPTTIFLILALACFSRSSPRLERWLLEHKKFGPILIAWQTHHIVPNKAKLLAAAGMLIGIYFLLLSSAPMVALVCTVVIEAVVMAYLLYCPAKLDDAQPRWRVVRALLGTALFCAAAAVIYLLMS